MPLAAGDRLGPYEILSPIGKGGMGEVYKALDTRLHREVAIKVSAEKFSERFEREARAIAALNHPNICTLYDVGPNYLVMEYVEGEAINTRLKSGPIPLEESLTIARQIASALEAAHDKLITHRDLKPGNVMIKSDGVVKVLDFGLAKIGGAQPTSSMGDDSPTLTMAATQAGTILGTAQYMAPEQAKGKPVDKRADIWAFGVMLHEMVTGQQLFKREDLTETLAAVVLQEADLSAAPERIRGLLKRCLEKDPSKRLRDISGMELLLQNSGAEAPRQAEAPAPPKLPWIIAAALAVGVGVALWAPWRTPLEQRAVVLDIFPDKDQSILPNHPAVSPDGHAVALRIETKGFYLLAVRSLDSDEIRTLPGTEGANYAEWSPDSRSLVFNGGGKLKRIDVAGGPPQVLCDYNGSSIPFEAWSPAGVILFPEPNGDLWRVSDQGGTPERVTTLDPTRSDRRHGVAQFLPDGKHFLYFAQSSDPEKSAMVATSLDDKGKGATVLTNPLAAFYARGSKGDEYLLFRRDNALVAQSFDSASLKLSGEAFLVLPEVRANSDHPFIGVSASGVLAFAKNSAEGRGNDQLRWMDRSGKTLGDAGPPGTYTSFSLSPDELHVAVHKTENGNADVHLMDLTQKGLLTRFTFDPAQDQFPIWLRPDGGQVTFRRPQGPSQLYQKPVGGTATEKPVGQVPQGIPLDWSRDGQHLLYANGGGDLHILSGGKIEPFIQTSAFDAHGQFSPDGKWVAYDSTESGRQEVWMQPHPATGAKFQISSAGGLMPRWRGDGKELYFVTLERTLYAVPITLGPSPQWGAPVRLFQLPLWTSSNAAYWPYSVSANGQKFLVVDQLESGQAQPITVVTNWLAIAKRK
jgi:eukaryotic-like serine/threonine-protein kinase